MKNHFNFASQFSFEKTHNQRIHQRVKVIQRNRDAFEQASIINSPVNIYPLAHHFRHPQHDVSYDTTNATVERPDVFFT